MFSSFCRLVLRLFGWKPTARFPDSRKYVMVVAPHTSNWDFPIGILAAKAFRLDVRYLGKHTLFKGPFGWLFRMLGGIPVRRDKSRNLSGQMADHFESSDDLILCIAPEGTRSKTNHWKMGFYHIAKAANVPISMVYIDYERREIGGGDWFMPSDDMDADLDRMAQFYADHRGKFPHKESPVRHRRQSQEAPGHGL